MFYKTFIDELYLYFRERLFEEDDIIMLRSQIPCRLWRFTQVFLC
jgi:hypothetical protein